MGKILHLTLLALLFSVVWTAACAPGLGTALTPSGAPTSIVTSAAASATVAAGGTPSVVGTVLPLTTATSFPITSPIPPIGTGITPAVTSNPTLANLAPLGPTELRYRLIAKLGQPFFCDPDSYPVARVLSEAEFNQRYAEIQKNNEEFAAILSHNNLPASGNLTREQKQVVYQEHKKLNSIVFDPAGAGFKFTMRAGQAQAGVTALTGTIDANGAINVMSNQPSTGGCPICLDGQTLIDTPLGPVAVSRLENGMPLWTAGISGERQAAVVKATTKQTLPAGVSLLRIRLQDGRQIVASPGHPTMDGKFLSELFVGDDVDGSRISSIENVAPSDNASYDVLPSGDTGSYWANGILIRSTLWKFPPLGK